MSLLSYLNPFSYGRGRYAGVAEVPDRPPPGRVREDDYERGRAVERVKAGPSNIRLPAFLPYYDDQTGETVQARLAYRKMLASPNVKSSLLSKVFSVGSLDLTVIPAKKNNRKDQVVGQFIEHNLTKTCSGGVPQMAWSVLSGGCVDGWSLCEKVEDRETHGDFRGKIVLTKLKAKDVLNDVVPRTDEFRNVIDLQGLRYNAGEYFDPDDYLIYRHLPLYENPVGMSDLRAAYQDWWMLDTAKKLRALLIEKKVIPVAIGTYSNAAHKPSLEAALAALKSQNWISVPEGVKVDVIQLAMSADDVFDKFEQRCEHRIHLAIEGAVLQSLEGMTKDAAGNSQVHRTTADLRVWYLAAQIQALLNDRRQGLVRRLVDLNYVVDDYPTVKLSAVDVNELTQQWGIDQGLNNAGLDLSKEQLYERYGRRPPIDEADKLPGKPAGGPGGMPGQQPGGGLPFSEAENFCQEGPNRGKPGPCPGPETVTAPAKPRRQPKPPEKKPEPEHHPGAAHGSNVKVTPTDQMAAPRDEKGRVKQVQTKIVLTKQETGRVAESVMRAYLRDVVGIKDTVGLNAGKPNESIDLFGDSMAPEVKGGMCNVSKGAQQWRITFSMELGKKEQAAYDAMSEEQQAAWREKRQRDCLKRKTALLKEISREKGREIKPVTFTAIINPDTRTADIYRTEGYHQRIGWNDPRAKHVGSMRYDHAD